MHVQALSFVLQGHHLLGFAGQGLELPQASSCQLLGLLGRRVSQQVVQVLGQIVGLWTVQSETRETRTGAEDMGHSWTRAEHKRLIRARKSEACRRMANAGMLMQGGTRNTRVHPTHAARVMSGQKDGGWEGL